MDAQFVIGIVGVVTVVIILAIGVALLAGWFIPETVPLSYRYTLGGVMILYSVYRGTMIWIKLRRANQNEKI